MAARGALGWERRRLADESGVTGETIRRFESGASVNRSTEISLRTTFERNGVKFNAIDKTLQVTWPAPTV